MGYAALPHDSPESGKYKGVQSELPQPGGALRQHRLWEKRNRKEKYRVLLRRYGDCFLIHVVTLVASVMQIRLYVDAFQNPHSCFTHAVFARTYAGINVFLFFHFLLDSVILVFLHFVLAPKRRGPPNFQEIPCVCCGNARENDEGPHPRVPPLVKTIDENSGGSSSAGAAASPWGGLSILMGPAFDIGWSLISIVSGIHDWKTQPLFFFRLLGYAIHHERVPTSLRVLVALNKRLFDDGRVVLDMTYITDRVIAMGLPAMGVESLYRNPIEVLASYMRIYHPGAHMVINTCAERVYNRAYLHRVCFFPCKDHEVMPLERIYTFCQIAEKFLQSQPNSVVVGAVKREGVMRVSGTCCVICDDGVTVHCMGGKGRTGLMVTCWLIYSGLCTSAADAMQYYGSRRTDEFVPGRVKNLSNACQVRFLWYFDALRQRLLLREKPRIEKLRLRRCVLRLQLEDASIRAVTGNEGERIIIRLISLLPPEDAEKKHYAHQTTHGNGRSRWDYLERHISTTGEVVDYEKPFDSGDAYRESVCDNDGVSYCCLLIWIVLLRGCAAEAEAVAATSMCHGVLTTSSAALTGHNESDWFVDWSLQRPEDDGWETETGQGDHAILRCFPETVVAFLRSGVMAEERNSGTSQRRSSPARKGKCAGIYEDPPLAAVVFEEFGIEILVERPERREGILSLLWSNTSLVPVGQLWLRADLLHVSLPSESVLAAALRVDSGRLNRSDGEEGPPGAPVDTNERIQNLGADAEVVSYREISSNENDAARYVVVGFNARDIDFKSKSLKRVFTEAGTLLVCVFEVVAQDGRR